MRKQTKLVAVLSAAALLAIGASMTSFAATKWVQEGEDWVYLNSLEIILESKFIKKQIILCYQLVACVINSRTVLSYLSLSLLNALSKTTGFLISSSVGYRCFHDFLRCYQGLGAGR